MYRIGCDVGGTNTDAVILDASELSNEDRSKTVIAKCKTSTTENVTHGIRTAIENVLVQSQIDRKQVSHVAIGTTHFVNAVIEQDESRLDRVACIRLCGPYTRSTSPFSDYPCALRDIVEGPVFYLDGGLEIDGREITPLNPQQVLDTAEKIVAAGVRAVAIIGVFSALDHQGIHEDRCKQIIKDAHPHLEVVVSHTIGGPGLLVRENATILNAAILSFAKSTIRGFKRAMNGLGLSCPLYLTQNDGTLIHASDAAQLPIRTFASGPTNSLIGAAYLRGDDPASDLERKQVLVVDIGGTTSDICALLPSGFPRKAANFVEVAGVRTAFSMPEVYSIGLGGGSLVHVGANGAVSVGPDSVGHKLTQESLVFGGSKMTATDIMVAAGRVNLGYPEKVKHIPTDIVAKTIDQMRSLLERAIDRMKVSAEPVFVLLVGGGSIIFPENMSMHHKEPIHHDAANAVGAAISKVAGDIDVIEILANRAEDIVVEEIEKQAISRAVEAGADANDTHIAEMTKIPLQYVNNKATRILVKAIGSLSNASSKADEFAESGGVKPNEHVDVPSDSQPQKLVKSFSNKSGSMTRPSLDIDLSQYQPDVRGKVWYISSIDVELLAIGCGILGTGGGGSPYNMALYVFGILRRKGHGCIRVMSMESLKDEDICVFGSGYGAPSVSDERLQSGEEVPAAIEELNKVLGYQNFQGIVADEIGGGNGIITFPTSARFDRPVVDCDFMGRAYPTVEHCTPYVYGEPVLPVAMADAKGNVSVVVKAENNTKLEGMLRTTCVELGNAVGVTGRPLKGRVIKDYAIPNTLSQAWFLGRAVLLAREKKINIIEAIGDVTPVKLLYSGKIKDVSRDVSRGYTVGQCVIAPLAAEEHDRSDGSQEETRNLVITFQNEYLIAYHPEETSTSREKEILCVVPDLISILGSNGEALGSPDLRYGLQVQVIAMPAHPLWTQDERALRIGGPDFFKLDVLWKPVGEYRKPQSVIEVYNQP